MYFQQLVKNIPNDRNTEIVFFFFSEKKTKGNLTGVRPDVFQQTIGLGQSVQRVIGFTFGSDVTTQSISDVFTWNGSTFFVNFSNVDLNRSVIFSFDDSVGGRTFSWNV